MSRDTIEAKTAALEAFLKDHPGIKCTLPSSPDYPSVRELFNRDRCKHKLVEYAKSAEIPFTVRSGGHNLNGYSVAEGALTIDMRELSDIKISSDRQSATIEGGVLLGGLVTKLAEHALVTPVGTVPDVGYVGWATYGAYGPFSAHWGLGADQIIGATIVNADGEIAKADDNLLKGIRGAGGVFGIIVDLTVLAGAILFESQDIGKAFAEFNVKFQTLLSDGIPLELTIQQFVLNTPAGRLHAAGFTWSSDDLEEGQAWLNKIVALAPVIANTVTAVSVPEYLAQNGASTPKGAYGAGMTANLRRLTPEVCEVMAPHLAAMPSDAGAMFSIHMARGYSAKENPNSVVGTREPHFMLEILGFATTKEIREKSV